MTQFQYVFTRNGETITTKWADRETAMARMENRVGTFHDCGKVAGDGDSNPDGSHNGCPRNGGQMIRNVREI